MNMQAFICAALLCGVATAQAHVRVESVKPADKSHVQAPAAIELGFSEPAYLAELTLQRGKEPARKLKIPTTEDSVVVTVPLPPLAAGTYVVTYSVQSDDGHTTKGRFTFTVEAAVPAQSGASKDAHP